MTESPSIARPAPGRFVFPFLLLLSAAAAAAEIPFERRFRQTEVLGRHWERMLLHYPLRFAPGRLPDPSGLVLFNREGRVEPMQWSDLQRHPDGSVSGLTVSFYAELEPFGTFEFALNAGAPPRPAPDTGLRATAGEGQPVRLANRHIEVELPPPGRDVFDPPRDATAPDAADLGPLRAFRLAGGARAGGSRLTAAERGDLPSVESRETELLSAGPLFAEASVRYRFAGGGHYEVRVRVEAEAPLIRVAEEADLGRRGDPEVRAEYLLSAADDRGWIPDIVYRLAERNVPVPDETLVRRLAEAGIETPLEPPGAADLRRLPPAEADEDLFGLSAWYVWSDAALVCAFLREADLDRPPPRPFVGLIPLHPGTWRNAQFSHRSARLARRAGGAVVFSVPLTAPVNPASYLHTGEYDRSLSPTLVRRQWAITAGPAPASLGAIRDARLLHGHVNLDDYKDWILEWPENPAVTHPRQFFSRRELEAARRRLPDHPFRDVLAAYSDVTGDKAKAFAQALHLVSPKAGIWTGGGPLGHALHMLYAGGDSRIPWVSHYRQAQAAGWTMAADQALAADRLPPALRHRLRAGLAAAAYAVTEPDANSRGSGIHQGNPNMPVNRFMVLPQIAALIPDHPMAPHWLEVSAQYLDYKRQTLTAPKGAWAELVTYYGAAVPHLGQAALALANAGAADPDLFRLFATIPAWAANLLTPPDPRLGARLVPGFGHSGLQVTPYFLPAAVMLRNLDPGLASAFLWAWDQVGRPMEGGHGFGEYPRLTLLADAIGTADTPAAAARLMRSAWYPGFGAVLRAHPGDPRETFFAYRQGYLVSHCDANQGDFVLYAKGAPLSPAPLRAYVTHQDNDNEWGGPAGLNATRADVYNRVRFGRPGDYGGWPGGGLESNVNEFHAGVSADYLRGWGDWSRTDSWDLSSSLDNEGAPDADASVRWTRQVLFLKSRRPEGANYFLIRDTFGGTLRPPAWWHLRTVRGADEIAAAGPTLEVPSDQGASLHVTFLRPEAVAVSTVSGRVGLYLHGHAADLWKRAQGDAPMEERLTVAQVPAGPGEEFLAVLYPREAGEDVPVCETLAPGVVRSITTEATDYAFLGADTNLSFAAEDVVFRGRAGAVRIFPDRVEIVVASALGEAEAGYRGRLFRGPAPFERVVDLARLRPGVEKVSGPRWRTRFDDPRLRREGEGIEFEGAAGGVEVRGDGSVRLVLGPGPGRVGHGGRVVWGEGPFDLTYDASGLHGTTEGRERMLYAAAPDIERGVPVLWIDGTAWAPGSSGGHLALPVLEGLRRIHVRAAAQPELFD